MRVDARDALISDVPTLVDLYGAMKEEMVALHAMWPIADGLDEPIAKTFTQAIEDETMVLIGELDDVPFGFLLARIEVLLPQADGQRVGSIRLIFVEQVAREVGIAEVMRDTALRRFRDQGITKFDAHVLPGHRLAKNFFESGGFSARSIIMHHDDERA